MVPVSTSTPIARQSLPPAQSQLQATPKIQVVKPQRPNNPPQLVQQSTAVARARMNTARTASPMPQPRAAPRPRMPQYSPRPVNPANNVQVVTTPLPPKPMTQNVIRVTTPLTYNRSVGSNTEIIATKSANTSNSFNVDLEDSITAAKISKPGQNQPPQLAPTSAQNVNQLINTSISDEQKTVTLNDGRQMSLAKYKLEQFQHQHQQQATKQAQMVTTAAKTVIRGVAQNVGQQRPRAPATVNVPRSVARKAAQGLPQPKFQLPQKQVPNQLQPQQSPPKPPQDNLIMEQPRESARMLVVLQNGEQRLITFTLPKESCTVQELLEQVGVPFTPDTNIQCIPNPGETIDYLVTVGVQCSEEPRELVSAAESSLQQKQLEQQQKEPQQQAVQGVAQSNPQLAVLQQRHQQATNNLANQRPADPPPKYIPNTFAVCPFCGYSSLNHAQCQRCKRVFTEEPKKVPSMPAKLNKTADSDGAPTTTVATPLAIGTSEKSKKDMAAAIQKKFQTSNDVIK